MIEKKVTFVLGAGASYPYGLPLGFELRDLLSAASGNIPNWVAELSTALKIEKDIILDFCDRFRKSQVSSIDAFLSKTYDTYGEIGKQAIAAILIRCENEGSLYRCDYKENWYAHLWNALIDDADTHGDVVKNSRNIRIVSFNYDRSLEHFLFNAFKYTFLMSDGAAFEAVKSLKIMHVYGCLGEYSLFTSENKRAYISKINYETITAAANSIKIIPEHREDDQSFVLARDWFYWADRICFLGFGFDALNIKRLDLDSVIQSKGNSKLFPIVYASSIGLTDNEKNKINKLICPKLTINMLPLNNLMTIRSALIL